MTYKFTYNAKKANNVDTFYVPATKDLIQRLIDDADIQKTIDQTINIERIINDPQYTEKIVIALSVLKRLPDLINFLEGQTQIQDLPIDSEQLTIPLERP